MNRYLFLYVDTGEPAPDMSEEQMQAHMAQWFAWIEGGRAAGWLVDEGQALQSEGCRVGAEGARTDGPFVEAKEFVGGYSLVQADSLDAAVALSAGCPVFETGGLVEVRPVMVFD